MTRFALATVFLLPAMIVPAGPAQADGQSLIDPTRPYNTGWYEQRKTTTDGSYNLHSTLVSDDRRVAVINGHHVTEGESVGNAKVIRIGKHEVTLQSPNRQFTLRLLPDIVKKQP